MKHHSEVLSIVHCTKVLTVATLEMQDSVKPERIHRSPIVQITKKMRNSCNLSLAEPMYMAPYI